MKIENFVSENLHAMSNLELVVSVRQMEELLQTESFVESPFIDCGHDYMELLYRECVDRLCDYAVTVDKLPYKTKVSSQMR